MVTQIDCYVMSFLGDLNNKTAVTTINKPKQYDKVQLIPNTTNVKTPDTTIPAPFIINFTMLSKYFRIAATHIPPII